MSTNIKIGVFIVDEKDELLMIKEKVKKNNWPRWNIIKGSYGDHGNETIFEAAKRECLEEASVDVELVSITGCYLTGSSEDNKIQFNFIGKIISGEPKIAALEEQQSREEYITEVRWFNKNDLALLPKDEFISEKIFIMIQDWLKGNDFPLQTFKQF